MAIFKPLFCVALALVVWWAWPQRAWLSDPYLAEREPVTLRFAGFSELEQTEIEPSPLSVDWLGRAATGGNWSATPVVAEADEIPLGGGDVTISGTVIGLSANAGSAVVSLERVTPEGTAVATFLAGADGRYSATGLLGGTYRLRAYLPGQYASAGAQVLFVPADAELTADLGVVAPSSQRTFDVARPQLFVGGRTSFSFVAGQELVDDLGRLVASPVAGLVVDVRVVGASLKTPSKVVTNAQGSATVTVECTSVGSVAVVLSGVNFSHSAGLGSCGIPPAPPAPPAPSDPEPVVPTPPTTEVGE